MTAGDSDDSPKVTVFVFPPNTFFDLPTPWRNEAERLAYLERIRMSPQPLLVGDPLDDLKGNEIFDRITAFLEPVAPCEVSLFMRQGNRMVYHIRPRQQEYLGLIKDVIVSARKFLDELDVDSEDVSMADGHIRMSVPR